MFTEPNMKTSRCLCLLGIFIVAACLFFPAHHAQGGELTVSAYIDGRSDLLIQQNHVWWHHYDCAAPGRWGGADEPTVLNSYNWYPDWPSPGENRDCNCDSSIYKGLFPPLVQAASTITLTVVSGSGSVTIVEQPSESNDYTASVEFNDPGSGASWYEIKITYDTLPSLEPRAWFRADNGPVVNGASLVAQWSDRSGNGFGVSQETGSNRPLLVEDAINGLPAVRFDGNDDYLETPSAVDLALSGGNGTSVFVVVKPGSTQKTYADILDYSHDYTVNFVVQQDSSTTNSFYYQADNAQQLSTTDFQVFTAVETRGVEASTYLNGGNEKTGAEPYNYLSEPNYLTVGNKSLDRYPRQFNGDIAEILFYNKALGASEKGLVETYLSEKYGITLSGYTVSGTITSSGSPLPDVAVSLVGPTGTTTVTTGSDGSFAFTGVVNGSYTLEPALSGYTFTPSSREVTVTDSDVTGQDFTATPAGHSISGTITRGGSGFSGVTVRLRGGASLNATTGSTGAFSFAGLADGAYTITPVKNGYVFSPARRSTNVKGADVTGQDFTGSPATYAVSGTVTCCGSPLSGVTVKLTGDSTGSAATGSDGAFSFTVPNGSYTLTPAKKGYTFSPLSLAVKVSGSALSGRNFAAVPRAATVRIALPAAGAAASRKAYRMVGIPVIPGNSDTFTTLAKFFGGVADSSVWRLYRSNYAQVTHAGQDSIRYGKGWWIVSSKAKNLAVSGAPKASDFTCALTSDYQMVACPYVDGNVSWTKVRSDSDNGALGLGSTIYSWDGSGEYSAVKVMKPGWSYWVSSTARGKLHIKRTHMVNATASGTGQSAVAATASDAASVQGPPPLAPGAALTIVSPSGGERLAGGRTRVIRWKSAGISPAGIPSTVNVAFSSDGGGSWTVVAHGVPNSGSYAWRVPETCSKRCLIRISSTLYPQVSGKSTRIFRIE
mgnify:CR=1 FL=1